MHRSCGLGGGAQPPLWGGARSAEICPRADLALSSCQLLSSRQEEFSVSSGDTTWDAGRACSTYIPLWLPEPRVSPAVPGGQDGAGDVPAKDRSPLLRRGRAPFSSWKGWDSPSGGEDQEQEGSRKPWGCGISSSWRLRESAVGEAQPPDAHHQATVPPNPLFRLTY